MIVVTGATGNVGRPLVQRLVEAGEGVTALSRGTVPEEGSNPRYRQADLSEPDGLRSVLEGADALYLILAGGGADLDPHGILGAVKAAGVERVVLQSSQAARTRPGSPSHDRLREFEEAVRRAGTEWTVLRPGGFASNSFAWAESVRGRREVSAPFGDVGLPVIDPADIAAVAAEVLVGSGHEGRTYELTGPSAVTPREQARVIGEAVGEPVRFVELSREEARNRMLGFMPEVVVDGTLAILGSPSEDERTPGTDVERVLGRAPRPFADWVARNAAAFGGSPLS